MTQPHDDEYGETLRRVLRAEAEEFTPSAEGLERIRSKIEDRQAKQLWWQMPWVRPVVAVGGAMVLAGIVMVGTPGIRATVISAFSPSAPTGKSTPITPPGNNQGYPTNGSPTPTATPTDSGESGGPYGGACDREGGKVTTLNTPSSSPSPSALPSECVSTSPPDEHTTPPTEPPHTHHPTHSSTPTDSSEPSDPSNSPTTTDPKPSGSNPEPAASP